PSFDVRMTKEVPLLCVLDVGEGPLPVSNNLPRYSGPGGIPSYPGHDPAVAFACLRRISGPEGRVEDPLSIEAKAIREQPTRVSLPPPAMRLPGWCAATLLDSDFQPAEAVVELRF